MGVRFPNMLKLILDYYTDTIYYSALDSYESFS